MGDLIGLLLGVGVIGPALGYGLARSVLAGRAAEQRRWLAAQRPLVPPVAAGARAPRGGRVPRPAVSPAAGGPAAEVPSPDGRTSAAVENPR